MTKAVLPSGMCKKVNNVVGGTAGFGGTGSRGEGEMRRLVRMVLVVQ